MFPPGGCRVVMSPDIVNNLEILTDTLTYTERLRYTKLRRSLLFLPCNQSTQGGPGDWGVRSEDLQAA